MSFPAYPAYKDSGVGWLSQIPDHWDIAPLKRLLDIKNGADYKHVEQEFGYPVIGSGGPFAWASEYLFDGESVLLGRKGTVDKPLYVTGRFWTVDTMYWSKIRPSNNGKFAFYTATTLPFSYYTTSTALPSMTQAALNAHPVALPPPAEQAAIAALLDRETAKIDALVEEQRRLIALLKEKRQAVISHAVIKGLNPGAPMKDSGVEWLGEVPAHWEILPLRRSVRQFVDYRGATPNKVSDGVPLITASQIKNGRIDHSLDPVFISEDEYAQRMTRGFPARGDLLLTTEAPLGEAALIEDEKVAPGQRIIMMKVAPQKMTSGYLLAHFRSDFGQSELWTRSSGSTASGIRADRLRASLVLVPPLKEQRSIVRHIEQQTASFEDAFNVANEAMRLLHERRTALVSAAVTGKIDVRGSAKVLPFPVDRARARGLVAAEIIERSAHQATFGRIKLQKISYLAETHAGIAELEGAHLREAAGPFDREMIREMEREAGALAGVRVEQPDGPGSAVTYRLSDRRGAHREELSALLGDRAGKFDKLISDIGTIDTKGAEAVATLFAVWNDALIDGETPSDTEIKLAVLSEWHPEKARKFRLDELQTWLEWMRRHSIVPTGTGPKTSIGRLFV